MTYFGKDCFSLSGMWLDEDYNQTYTQQDYEPEISYCTHISNKNKFEGNCNYKNCPLDKHLNYTFKMPKLHEDRFKTKTYTKI